MGSMFSTNKELCNGKMSDIFYGKLKMCFNKTTSNSGQSWERKIIQDEALIHCIRLKQKFKKKILKGIYEITKQKREPSKNGPQDN